MTAIKLNPELLAYVADPSVEKRTRIAHAVGQYFAGGDVDHGDRVWVRQVLEQLLADAEVYVRHAVSVQLCETPLLPTTWALQLAQDVDKVAAPVLRHSPVLTDDELVRLARSASQGKLHAISQRPAVSDRVGAALVDHGDGQVVTSLVRNPGAALSERTMTQALQRHADDDAVHRRFLSRGDLPPELLLKLAIQANDAVRGELIGCFGIPHGIVDQIVKLAEEQAVEFLTHEDAHRVDGLAAALLQAGRLSDTLLLRTLLEGRVRFFCAGMAARTGTAPEQARQRLFQDDAFQRSRFYREAGVAEALFSAFNAVVSAAQPYVDNDREVDARFQEHALWRIVSVYREIAPGDVNAVLAQLQKYAMDCGS